MPTSTNVTNLKINELKESQYDTAVQQGIIGANEISILTDAEAGQVIQVATLPTASADELGNIYQFVGTTDANYTNGYFYKCVSDGAVSPTYSWTAVEVQASSGGLPSQSGNSGKFLTTDGTDASWGATVGVSMSVIDTDISQNEKQVFTFGNGTSSERYWHFKTSRVGNTLEIGAGTNEYVSLMQYSFRPKTSAMSDLGAPNQKWKTTYTTKINNGGDITVPSVAGSMAVQVSTIPTADSTLEGQIYQYIGATDSTYTNGHFYQCVSDGQSTPTYSWTEVQLGGGGSSYTAGTGIDITGGVISVASPTLQNGTTNNESLAIVGTVGNTFTTSVGVGAEANGNSSTAYGNTAKAYGEDSIAIGRGARVSQNGSNGRRSIAIGHSAVVSGGRYGIQLGTGTNSEAGTFCVGLGQGVEEYNYKLLDLDGTIPTARLTKVNSTITLTAAGWSSNTQTVNVTGMTATGVVMVSPDPTDQSAYTSAGILCTAQAAGTLTFTCDTVPSGDIDVNVVML